MKTNRPGGCQPTTLQRLRPSSALHLAISTALSLYRRTPAAIAGCLAAVALTTALLSASAQAQTYSVLYNFGTYSTDASTPKNPGALAQGRDGNLYGTTLSGGTTNQGAVYRITPAGALSVLYNFDGTHGSAPSGGLILGTDGNLYGAASAGGTLDFGTVFKITPHGTLTVIYNFQGSDDGCAPVASPIQGSDGNLYGTTSYCGSFGHGGVYRLTTTGVLTPFIGSIPCTGRTRRSLWFKVPMGTFTEPPCKVAPITTG